MSLQLKTSSSTTFLSVLFKLCPFALLGPPRQLNSSFKPPGWSLRNLVELLCWFSHSKSAIRCLEIVAWYWRKKPVCEIPPDITVNHHKLLPLGPASYFESESMTNSRFWGDPDESLKKNSRKKKGSASRVERSVWAANTLMRLLGVLSSTAHERLRVDFTITSTRGILSRISP